MPAVRITRSNWHVRQDTDLWNRGATRTDTSPVTALRAFLQLVSMSGTDSERSFHALPFAMQLALAPLLPALLTAPRLVASADAAGMTALCERIRAAVDDARALLPAVYSGVKVEEFYDICM